MFKESSKGVQVILKGISSNFKGVLRVFKKSSTGMAGKFYGDSRKFPRSFKSGSKSVKGISRKFQRRLKTVSREFSVGFNFAPNPISSLR